jgi:4-hydroxymandelate oxidase
VRTWFAQRTNASAGSRRKVPPRDELVNVLEFEDVAKLVLSDDAYSTIAGSSRAAFDRITFRPRMLIPTLDLDLSVGLFGDTHFTPILVGPVADQRRYHANGELATARGASASKAGLVVSSRSSVPIAEIAAEAKTPLWYAVYAGDPANHKRIQDAVAAGCEVICITVTVPGQSAPNVDWKAINQLRKGVDVPIVVKGIMTTGDAKRAVEQGVNGIVVSDHGRMASDQMAPIAMLPAIADAVGDKTTLLVDGSFRRGSDILKALVLGARAVVLARPIMWGLAGYGAEGVQSVIEMLQTDLGRHLAALGASNIATLNRSMVRIHRR